MVLSYDYVATNKCTSFAGHLDGHAEALKQYMRHHPSMSRATPEATGRCHWATTHSVSPRWPPGGQQIKQKCNMYPLGWPFWWPSLLPNWTHQCWLFWTFHCEKGHQLICWPLKPTLPANENYFSLVSCFSPIVCRLFTSKRWFGYFWLGLAMWVFIES